MTVPLIVLAICTIAFSVVLTPAWPWLHSYLTGEPAHASISAQLIQPMLLRFARARGAGIGLGCLDSTATPASRSIRSRKRSRSVSLSRKQDVDGRTLRRTVIASAAIAARISDWMDRYFWDGLVRGCRRDRSASSEFSRKASTNTASTPASTKRRRRARSRPLDFRAGTPAKSKLISASIAVGMLALLILYAWLA